MQHDYIENTINYLEIIKEDLNQISNLKKILAEYKEADLNTRVNVVVVNKEINKVLYYKLKILNIDSGLYELFSERVGQAEADVLNSIHESKKWETMGYLKFLQYVLRYKHRLIAHHLNNINYNLAELELEMK